MDEINVFDRITHNNLFWIIIIICCAGQVLITTFGGIVFECYKYGLNGPQWGICFAFGAGGIIWSVFLKCVREEMCC